MAIRKCNSEGYYDPTAYEALSKVEAAERKARYRPLVYICSPYSGNVEFNVANARIYCRYALNNNCIPVHRKDKCGLAKQGFCVSKSADHAPHLLFPQFMNDEKERELAMFMNMVLLSKCEELWVFGNVVSKGMGQEIAKAEKRNMKIRYFQYELEEIKGL